MKTQSQPSGPPATPTYGIHLLKSVAIFMQIIAHTAIWCVQYSMYPLQKVGGSWDYFVPILISLSPMLPMTAGAVLRLMLPTSANGRQLTNIPWETLLWSLVFLMLVESIKAALVYQSTFFFSWNVLHLIALTSVVILVVGRFSIAALWVIALVILFYTPVVTAGLDVIEAARSLDNTTYLWPVKGLMQVGIFSLLMIAGIIALLRSRHLAARFRVRLLLLLGMVWFAGALLLIHTPNSFMDRGVFETAWIGILAGTRSGFHTWGIFPWAGVVMLGFLIYDLVIRSRANKFLLMTMCGAGLAIVVGIGGLHSDDFYQTFSRGSLVSSLYFNRFYLLPLLIMGLFCTVVPLAYWAAHAGWEKPYFVDLSRSILWVYVYQTSVLVFAAQWARTHLPAAHNSDIFSAFAVSSALLLPLLIKLIPSHIKFSLKKNIA
jgi:hypothetical protein